MNIKQLVPVFLFLLTFYVKGIDCQRKVTVLSDKELQIEVHINKGDLQGIARLADLIPEGATVKYAKTEGGNFDLKDNKVKVIWMNLPGQEQMNVSYILDIEHLTKGDYMISGKFSCVKDKQPVEIPLPSAHFNLSDTKQILVKEESVLALPTLATIQPITAGAMTHSAPVTTSVVSSPSEIITYSIQVLTSKEQLTSSYFKTNYGVSATVKAEHVNGLYKYTLGEFNSVSAASEYREVLTKKGLHDAFIVAWKNNVRISIEEAKKIEQSR